MSRTITLSLADKADLARFGITLHDSEPLQ